MYRSRLRIEMINGLPAVKNNVVDNLCDKDSAKLTDSHVYWPYVLDLYATLKKSFS
jgi:hypothetical protein